MMTLEALYKEADRFLWDNYRMTLDVDIEIEPDMEDKQGAYEFTATAPCGIYIADFVMDFAENDVVFNVLHHELVHYALHQLGMPFADGDPFFEAELSRKGIASSGVTRVGRYHIYECTSCGEELPYYRKFTDMEHAMTVTVCCDAFAKDTGRQAVYNGKERVY